MAKQIGEDTKVTFDLKTIGMGVAGLAANGRAGSSGSIASDEEQLIDVTIQIADKRKMDTICSFFKDIVNLGYSFVLRSGFMDQMGDNIYLRRGLIRIRY